MARRYPIANYIAFIQNSSGLKDFTLLDWAGWVAVRFSLAYILIALARTFKTK